MGKPRFFDRSECENCVSKGGKYCWDECPYNIWFVSLIFLFSLFSGLVNQWQSELETDFSLFQLSIQSDCSVAASSIDYGKTTIYKTLFRVFYGQMGN